MVGCIACGDRQIDKHRVNCVTLELRKALQEAVTGDDIVESTSHLSKIPVEKGFAGGPQLYRHVFAGEVRR